MGACYTYMLDEWNKIGGKTFVFAGDVSSSNKWGSWGLQENYLDTNAAKYKAVQQWLQQLRGGSSVDMNKDGATNILDYYYWQRNFGSTQQLNADANSNGVVDGGDYVMLRKAVMQQSAAIAAGLNSDSVPEPDSMMLAIGC